MEEEKHNKKKKKQKHHHPQQTSKPSSSSSPDFSFKPASDVKGLRFGGQLVVKSFTVRRASPPELPSLLSLPHNPPFPSTVTFLPTNFTILAHRAWHTLTLGLGTRKSKVLLLVFDSQAVRAAAERRLPPEIALGEVNRRVIKGLSGCEMARFKFRKGCVTFYVYAVRRVGDLGFSSADDLRLILQSVVDLKDFVDHTAMLAVPAQRTIGFYSAHPHAAMAH